MITFFPLSATESFEHSRTNSRVCLAPCRFHSNKSANKHSSNQAASLVSSLLLSFVPIWGSFSRRKKEKEKEQFGLFLDLWKPWMVGPSKKIIILHAHPMSLPMPHELFWSSSIICFSFNTVLIVSVYLCRLWRYTLYYFHERGDG